MNKLIKDNLVIFTHTDLDGIGSAVVANWLYGDLVKEVLRVDNRDVTEELDRLISNKEEYFNSTIAICDHSPSLSMYNKLVDSGLDFYVFDHHKSSELQDLSDNRVVIDLNQSGTQLFYEWVVNNEDSPRVHAAGRFVYHVNDYDLWIHESLHSKELCRLFFELGWDKFLDRFSKDISVAFSEGESFILDLAEDNLKSYCKSYDSTMRTYEDQLGNQYAVVFAERNQSELGHYIINKFKVDYVAMINTKSLSCSLRSAGGVDVSKIAKDRSTRYSTSGGGHLAAAGFSYRIENLPNLIKELFKL